ncbi:MAG: efflux RND transporter periplasmic adaptor subunit [Desulfosalsimonadaceae bacterium]
MPTKKQAAIQAIAALIIIAGGFLGFKALQAGRQDLERRAPETVYPMVRTITASTGTIDIIIEGEGTVRPVSEIQLVPRVGGKVVRTSPALVNGGAFSKGDLLLAIEEADYKIAFTLARAGVREAESRYEIAREDAEAARAEWQRMNPGREPSSLAAKEPQLAAAEAHLDAQRANLEKARLDLERTKIIAPFNGRAGSDNVSEGQFVTPGQPLGSIYDTDTVEIVVPLESSALEWFDVPGFNSAGTNGASAVVSAEVAGRKMTWQGRVVRAQGKIDPQTRMVNVVIRVDAPYAVTPPLYVGQFANVRIQGAAVSEAAVIPRAALREADTVWVVDEADRLSFRKVTLAWKDSRGMVIRQGLDNGERVVISTLASVTDGMQVRPVDAGN